MKIKKKKIAVLFILLLIAGIYLDRTDFMTREENQIERGDPGLPGEQYTFQLNAEDVLEDYDYSVSVDARLPEKEEIREALELAKNEINESFCVEGEDVSHITQDVTIADFYADGLVTAEWSFDNYDVIDSNGKLQEDFIPEEGYMVEALADLACYGQRELYAFSFKVFPKERSRSEQLLADIDADIRKQLAAAGEKYLILPAQVDGIRLCWSQKKSHYFWKILFLELVLAAGLLIGQKEDQKKARQMKQQQMQQDYPEIVSKMLVLTGAGMSIKQAWNKISALYSMKRNKKQSKVREAYEQMLITNREMMDGESERVALQKFGERVGLGKYHRFSRLLAENLEKGARGMEVQLEREAAEAFEERKNIARKLGEEAGTKMLLPMMLLLGMVMAIIMIPAVMSFQG